jgi:outer membrane protease
MATIKKISILVILSVLFLIHAEAETGKMSFSISPAAGFLYGHAEEIVYRYPNRDLYTSELLWDLKPLFYAGLAADLGPANPFRQHGFIASLSFKYGLPLRTGIIENRDWLNHRIDHYTHYSRHEAHSRGAFFAGISAGYSFCLNNFFALGVYSEFSYMRLSWSAWNGYVQHPPFDLFDNYPKWSDSLPKTELSGEVIRYTQNWFILAPGLSLKWKASPYFLLMGNINYSPLIYCFARDDHILRNITFLDYLYFGHYLKGSGDFIFYPAKNLDLSLSLSYKSISGTRGDAYVGNTRYRQSAGAGFSALGLGVAARIRLAGRD